MGSILPTLILLGAIRVPLLMSNPFLEDPDPALGLFDSMVEGTLYQLNIATNPPDDEPARVAVPVPIHQVNGRLPAKELLTAPRNDYDAPCSQIDTGAMVSCTDQLHILHNYRAYDETFPCPIRLSSAVNKSDDCLPLGFRQRLPPWACHQSARLCCCPVFLLSSYRFNFN